MWLRELSYRIETPETAQEVANWNKMKQVVVNKVEQEAQGWDTNSWSVPYFEFVCHSSLFYFTLKTRSSRFPSLRKCGDFEPRNPRQLGLVLRGDPIGEVCEKSTLPNASIYVSWTFVVKTERYTCRKDRCETSSGIPVVSDTQAVVPSWCIQGIGKVTEAEFQNLTNKLFC